MAKFVDRQRKSRERNRPAVNFTQRDDVRDFARSAHGQNYNRMMDIQRQLPGMDRKDPLVQEFKDRRKTFNRYGKYPMGEMLGTSPLDMQDKYMDLSRNVRQTNKPVYNEMYPISGGIMHLGEQGGILGAILSEIGKMGKDRGITTAVDDTEEEQIKYVADTFGKGVTDESVEEVYEGPWPHEDMPYLSDEAAAIQKEFNTNPYFQNLKDSNVVLPFEKERRGHPHLETYTPDAGTRLGTVDPHEPEDITVAPWLTDPSIPMPEELVEGEYLPGQDHTELIEEEVIPPVPFDDSNREAGIAALYGQGPQWGDTNRRYEKEYGQHMMSGGEMMPYEVFERMYEEIYQGKPHALHSSYR